MHQPLYAICTILFPLRFSPSVSHFPFAARTVLIVRAATLSGKGPSPSDPSIPFKPFTWSFAHLPSPCKLLISLGTPLLAGEKNRVGYQLRRRSAIENRAEKRHGLLLHTSPFFGMLRGYPCAVYCANPLFLCDFECRCGHNPLFLATYFPSATRRLSCLTGIRNNTTPCFSMTCAE